MKHHLNTLFITTDDAYVSKDGEALAVKVEKVVKLRVPILNLGGVVCFGRVGMSSHAMGLCADRGVSISFCSASGRLRARVLGFTPGNVLLRREQYRRADSLTDCLAIAQPMVAAKIANSRSVVLRALRDDPPTIHRPALEAVAVRMAESIGAARAATALDVLMGVEGEAANEYFGIFNRLIADGIQGFVFQGRTRRPPLDNVNALLSFLYSMLTHDARTGCESAGLDAQVGFLHKDRPGKPSLALDLIEELRAFLCDRLALSLINRRQVAAGGFVTTESGAIEMDDATRRTVLAAYQKRKQETITHPYLQEKTTVGLLVHLQARLLARHLRGDLDLYPPFIWK